MSHGSDALLELDVSGGDSISTTTAPSLGSVPRTPDSDASAQASRYKWEPYCDTDWCIHYFLPRGENTLAKVSR